MAADYNQIRVGLNSSSARRGRPGRTEYLLQHLRRSLRKHMENGARCWSTLIDADIDWIDSLVEGSRSQCR